FSSYLGGQSANRGLCKQPCRRHYQTDKQEGFPFNLKDNQQLENIALLKQAGIKSLKVEGRLKSAEYVYRIAKAYRLVLDEPHRQQEAYQLLNFDPGREKTGYFLQGNITDAISDDPYSGKLLGRIEEVSEKQMLISTTNDITPGNRLRVRPNTAAEGTPFKVVRVEKQSDRLFKITGNIPANAKRSDRVYLTELRQERFPSKIDTRSVKLPKRTSPEHIKEIVNSVKPKSKTPTQEEVFVRADSIAWIRKIAFPHITGLILNLSRSEWESFRPDTRVMQRYADKIIVELPKFIPENTLPFYQNLISKLQKAGFRRFSLSHLSQKLLCTNALQLISNENVYTLNDAAVRFIKQEGIHDCIFPLENDWENLQSSVYKEGILPVYFTPSLFYSRMPVQAKEFTSDKNEKFHRTTIDGITHIYPDIPVSLLQYTHRLRQAGFKRFLIDLSFEKPSGNRLETLLKRLGKSEQVQPSGNFNFVKGGG
ncbi:MAG: U32 family peptidase, partial [Bacteroidales bacterium]